MNRYFEKDQILSFPECEDSFTVLDTIGYGSSCAVYLTEASNGTRHILKEYNPCYLDVLRRFDGLLYVDSEDDEEEFTNGLERFKSGYSRQIKIRKMHGLTNSTSNIQGIYSAYGTEYIDMTLFDGKTLDKIQYESFYDFVRCLSSITSVVGNYHANGFLHLDIKPENIFTIPETPEIAMLFDFDSVIEKNAVSKGINLSYTKLWAAPEQLNPSKNYLICEATDIYAIGEILFYQIYGRHSHLEERREFSDYSFDSFNPMLNGLEKPAMDLIGEILKHTIANDVSKRFQSCNDLLLKLDELEKITCPDVPTIISKLPNLDRPNLYSEQEYNKIDNLIDENEILFFSGSHDVSLILEYVKNRSSRYNKIIHLLYISDFVSMVTDDNMLIIKNCKRYENESITEYCTRKLKLFSQLISENDLLVICNFSNPQDPLFRNIKELKCKKIFLSNESVRNEPGGIAPQIDLSKRFFENKIISIIRHELFPKIDSGITIKNVNHYFIGDKITNALKSFAENYNIDPSEVIYFAYTSEDDQKRVIMVTTEFWISIRKYESECIIPFSKYMDLQQKKYITHLIDLDGNDCGELRLDYYSASVNTIKKILWTYHNEYKIKQKDAIHFLSKEEIFEKYILDICNDVLIGTNKRFQSDLAYTQKTGMPNSVLRAIATYAHGVDPSDIILFMDGSCLNVICGTVITSTHCYISCGFNLKTSFAFENVVEFKTNGLFYKYYYVDKNGKKKNVITPDGGENGLYVISEISKKYRELLPNYGDHFNKDKFTKHDCSLY